MTEAASSIRVLIVEDSPLVRHGIRAAIESETNGAKIEIVGEAATAAAAIEEAQKLHPDVVLLDLRLPDDTGVNVCRKLRMQWPKLCIIVLTSSTDDASIYGSVVAGAQGYLLKEIHPSTLTQAIIDGHAGRPVFSGDIASRVLDMMRENHAKPDAPSGLASLSPQEKRVIALISEGHTNKAIAQLMELSENTVKNYIAHTFEKLGVERRSQAVALFLSSNPNRLK